MARPDWLLNVPKWPREQGVLAPLRQPRTATINATAWVDRVLDECRANFSQATDLENVDAVEHFFWSREMGIALEVGAGEGTWKSHSMTFVLEKEFRWKRVLIEGNPNLRDHLSSRNRQAVTVSAALSSSLREKAWFSPATDVGGLVETMTPGFIRYYHQYLNNLSTPLPEDQKKSHSAMTASGLLEVPLVPLQLVLDTVGLRHINLFILDVEGSELQALQGIDFSRVSFDVLVVETSIFPYRPNGYTVNIIRMLEEKGYMFVFHLLRNLWFQHKKFVPSVRPGATAECFSSIEHTRRPTHLRCSRDEPRVAHNTKAAKLSKKLAAHGDNLKFRVDYPALNEGEGKLAVGSQLTLGAYFNDSVFALGSPLLVKTRLGGEQQGGSESFALVAVLAFCLLTASSLYYHSRRTLSSMYRK